MKKLPYKEGDAFAIPLLKKGFALGVVARSPRAGKVLLGYFFRYGKMKPPKPDALVELKPEDAVLVVIFGDLGLYSGEWPVVGHIKDWNRSKWPMPSFLRREPLTGVSWKVTYAEDNPAQEIEIVRLLDPEVKLERDAMRGTEGLRLALSKLHEGEPA